MRKAVILRIKTEGQNLQQGGGVFSDFRIIFTHLTNFGKKFIILNRNKIGEYEKMFLLAEASFALDVVVQLLGSVVGAFLGFVLAIVAENLIENSRQKKANISLFENFQTELKEIADAPSLNKIYDVANFELYFAPSLEEIVRSQSARSFIRKKMDKGFVENNFFEKIKDLELRILRINKWYRQKNDFYFNNNINIRSLQNVLTSQKLGQITSFNQIDITKVSSEGKQYIIYCQFILDEITNLISAASFIAIETEKLLNEKKS